MTTVPQTSSLEEKNVTIMAYKTTRGEQSQSDSIINAIIIYFSSMQHYVITLRNP